MHAAREGFFDSAGVNLHYLDWGGSGRALVLLPGLGGTAHLFRGLAPRLAERFRVAALTRRGHGRFANRYPDRVEAVIYLDALHVLLELAHDPAADPAFAVLETQPRPEDLVSREAYLAFIKRSRPDLASIWCEAVEADRLDYVTALARHGPATAIVAKMLEGLGPHREPAYGDVKAPALALVLGGTTHPFLPPGASDELARAANAYYVESFVPRIRRRTDLFREAAPDATVIELGTSNHTIFVAREDETIEAIFEFLRKERA